MYNTLKERTKTKSIIGRQRNLLQFNQSFILQKTNIWSTNIPYYEEKNTQIQLKLHSAYILIKAAQ